MAMANINDNDNEIRSTVVWSGILEWTDRVRAGPSSPTQRIQRELPCEVYSRLNANEESEVAADGFPPKLVMQLTPKCIMGHLGRSYFIQENSKTVQFTFPDCDASDALMRADAEGYLGCVHVHGGAIQNGVLNIKLIFLVYSAAQRGFIGFIPNDQVGFVHRVKSIIRQKAEEQRARQAAAAAAAQGQAQGQGQGQVNPFRFRAQIRLSPGQQMGPDPRNHMELPVPINQYIPKTSEIEE